MRKHILKKSITGFLTALLVLSMPLQSFGATMTGMRASSAYTNQTGQGAQADYASSAEVLKQLREIPAFDAGFYADTYPDALSALIYVRCLDCDSGLLCVAMAEKNITSISKSSVLRWLLIAAFKSDL